MSLNWFNLIDMFHRIRWPHSWDIIQNEETGDIIVSEWSCGWSSKHTGGIMTHHNYIRLQKVTIIVRYIALMFYTLRN